MVVMSASVLFAVFVVLSALIFVAARRLWARNASKPRCRWERDELSTTALAAWVCRTCGEQAFSGDERQPTECKKELRAGF